LLPAQNQFWGDRCTGYGSVWTRVDSRQPHRRDIGRSESTTLGRHPDRPGPRMRHKIPRATRSCRANECRARPPRLLHGSDSTFDCPVILLHYVIEKSHRTTSAASAEFTAPLELTDDPRIARIAVHVDDPWTRVAGSLQSLLKETFGRSRVTRRGEKEVDRRACGSTARCK